MTENPLRNEEVSEAPPAPSAEEALKQEIATLQDRALRAAAEAENIRKRAEKEREDTAKYAISGFAQGMVEVAENLRRALDAKDAGAEALATGVEMTWNELLRVFERHGLRRIDPAAGEKFDHHFHQAVAQVEAPGTPTGHVAQVLSAGYAIHDRLLKPAMVTVAKAAEAPPPPAGSAVDTQA